MSNQAHRRNLEAKVEKIFSVKETNNKTKREPTEWEKIVVNDKSNKGLIAKICKEHQSPPKNPNI